MTLRKTRISTAVERRSSPVHGSGVFATRRIPTGAFVGYYAGRVYDAEEAALRDWNHQLTHVFGLSDGSLIDGSQDGNSMRFLNHSCEPNCAAYEVDSSGLLEIRIEALRPIGAGEELSLDYCLDVGGSDPADYACRCGTASCRGSLAAVHTEAKPRKKRKTTPGRGAAK